MLRRPMLFAALGCAGGVVVSYFAGVPAAFFAACGGAAACGLLLRGSDGEADRLRLIAIIVLVSYCLGLLSFWHMNATLARDAGLLTDGGIRGEITACGTKKDSSGDQYLQMTVRTESGRVLCKCYDGCVIEGEAAEGCVVTARGVLRDPQGRRNPNCFDYSLYLRSLGVVKTMTCNSVTVSPAEPFSRAPLAHVRYRVYEAREGFIERLSEDAGGPTASLIRAIMFGDKGSFDDDVLESFRKNGTAHILAVSGLHIGIIYGFILKLWRWRRGWAFLMFNTVFFLLYAAASGFSPSVTRAVVMVLLHIAAGIGGWRYDLANAAFVVFTAVILLNPFMVFNSGFQMSFLAVLSLTLVMPYLKRFYSGVFLASAAIQVGLGPFILYSFNYFSLLAVFINVPVVALAGIIVPLALVNLALGVGAFALKPLCEALLRLNETIQIDGLTTFQTPSPPLWLMAAYYLCLLVFATEEGRLRLMRAPRKGRHIVKMVLLVGIMSAVFAAFASDGYRDCDLTFVDVGQGDCICVRVDDGLLRRDCCYLFDGGGNADYSVGKKVLRDYLLKNGLSRVDGAFVTHLHTDHYKGICELSKEGMVDRVYVYEANELKKEQIMEDTGLSGDRIVFLAGGDCVSLSGDGVFPRGTGPDGADNGGVHKSDSVYAEVLHPERKTAAEYAGMIADETDENLMSLVFKVTFSGSSGDTSVLITGDMGEEGEKELLRKYGYGLPGSKGPGSSVLRADILKVGHHGSKTSSTEPFLDAVSPETAVIQVGLCNMYGHPAPETLERLAAEGADIYRNDLMGAIGFEIRKGKVKEVKTIIEEKKTMKGKEKATKRKT
ncbi:MAG: DNA internalization-related competence protein ComEC/Rec2 [Bacillota bacterium]